MIDVNQEHKTFESYLSSERLSDSQKEEFDLIISDLKIIFKKESIENDQLSDLLTELKSEEVKKYLTYLHRGSKKETALREAFFAGISILSKFLSDDESPEVNLDESGGFIDYEIGNF